VEGTSSQEISSTSTHNNNQHFLSKYRYSKVASNTRLSAGDWEQDVRHIILDITNTGLLYEPGDIVDILPRNLRDDALEFLKYMNIDPSIIVNVTPNDEGIICVCTN
jgi:sulfite reductase alpha subunit-like flavoprotein